MKLIKASIDIDELIKNQDTIIWEDVLDEQDFTKEEINKLSANVNNKDFWNVIGEYTYIDDIDVKYLVEHQDNCIWNDIFDSREFTEEEIKYLCNNVKNNDFWFELKKQDNFASIKIASMVEMQNNIKWPYILDTRKFTDEEIKYLCDNVQNDDFWHYISICSEYINKIDINYLIEHQNNLQWGHIVYKRQFEEQDISCLCQNVTKKSFWINISRTNYVNNINIECFVANQDKFIWGGGGIFDNRKFTNEELQYLCDNITKHSFWVNIYKIIANYHIDVKTLGQHQDNLFWIGIFNNRKFTDEEIKYLCENVKNDKFWQCISDTKYIALVNVKHLVEYQDHCIWEDIFNNRTFTNDELEYLYDNVENAMCIQLINTRAKAYNMTYQELINNRNIIDWDEIDLDKLSISENEKKLLLTKITTLGIKYAENISDDFSQIKNKPIKNFYTIGNRDMHGSRTGAFVVVKDGNHPAEVLVEPGGSHYPMLQQMAEKYGYSQDTLMVLMNVEAGTAEISGKMDLDAEEEKELEYAKEHLHCCCGYIHVDKNNENPIAIMDATRVYNFSPQEVARILAKEKYEGQDIIAFGINDAGASSVAFMKVAKITKKRLISHNFRILYWYNNGC